MKSLPQLKHLREQQTLSLRELAKISGVSHVAISRIERGERQARPSTIRKLADALGVDPTILRNETSSDPEFEVAKINEETRDAWIRMQRDYIERYVAGRDPNMKCPPFGVGVRMLDEDLVMARVKLNSGIDGELEESVQQATRASRNLARDMAAVLEGELKAYEALPSHYFEDPSAARRIREVGASMASSHLQDLKVLQEFINVSNQASLKLSTDRGVERRYPTNEAAQEVRNQ